MTPDHDQTIELIRCALNRGQRTLAHNGRRRKVLQQLVIDGLMTSGREVHFGFYLARGESVTLTDVGRAAILALDPAAFAGEHWYPLPQDVRSAQERVRGEA